MHIHTRTYTLTHSQPHYYTHTHIHAHNLAHTLLHTEAIVVQVALAAGGASREEGEVKRGLEEGE